MKKFLLPLVLLLVGTGGGVAAGLILSPSPSAEAHDAAEAAREAVGGDAEATIRPPAAAPEAAGAQNPSLPTAASEGAEYVRLGNQFVVPVVENARVTSMVVLSLSVEVEAGWKNEVIRHEPKLRDAFLQVLFDHANVGGFSGNYTSASNMRILREALRTASATVLGAQATDVLIVDMVRQEV